MRHNAAQTGTHKTMEHNSAITQYAAFSDYVLPAFAAHIPSHLWEADDRDDCLLYEGSVRVINPCVKNYLSSQFVLFVEWYQESAFTEVATSVVAGKYLYELNQHEHEIREDSSDGQKATPILFSMTLTVFDAHNADYADIVAGECDNIETRITWLFVDPHLAMRAMQGLMMAHMEYDDVCN